MKHGPGDRGIAAQSREMFLDQDFERTVFAQLTFNVDPQIDVDDVFCRIQLVFMT